MSPDTDAALPRTVRSDSFLTLHYQLARQETGEIFVSTFGFSPATLQMGSGQLAEGLERCLLGLAEGAKESFTLPPEAAFGAVNPRLLEWVALSALPAELLPTLRENALVEFTAPEGQKFSGFLRERSDTRALFDFNHPLAGRRVRFEVEIVAIL
ncbi:MAG: FKBP-type peptidyl-prolyl cis-trans isomerase [Zoogloeaceae bacterium]|jgi:FKBP-type peptidyl-prolyl cis-trans isomerase SlpA|nr:FKBP-type peptidyl-prolyl cis-trans isomerase [Zoogloeaceae bacterium]